MDGLNGHASRTRSKRQSSGEMPLWWSPGVNANLASPNDNRTQTHTTRSYVVRMIADMSFENGFYACRSFKALCILATTAIPHIFSFSIRGLLRPRRC